LPSHPQRNKVCHHDFGEYKQAATANTLQRTSDKQRSKIVRYTSNDRSNHKENKGNNYHWLPAEDVREGGEIRLKDGRTKEEGGPGPEGLDRCAFKFVCDDLHFG